MPKPSIRLNVYHDGKLVVDEPVMNAAENGVDHAKVDQLLIGNPPPQARGSVATLVNVSLPKRHPKRSLVWAYSGHSVHGPRWSLVL